MKKTKRILAMMLSLVLCLSLLPGIALAADEYVKVTGLSDVTSGGQFVLVANGFAMDTTLQGNNKFNGIAVTPSGNTLSGNQPVWTFEAVEGGIAISVNGQYLAYDSSTNFKMQADAYTWTVTAGANGFIIKSAASTSRGIFLQTSYSRFGAYSSSNTSGYVFELELYKDASDASFCEHTYITEVIKAVTCTQDGEESCTCSKCGDAFTRDIVATGHEYVAGTCMKCGGVIVTDPAKVIPEAYALAKGEALPYDATLTGKVVSVDEAYSSAYKNITITIAVEGYEEQPIKCYRLKGTGIDTLAVGDVVSVFGTIKNYKGEIEFDLGCTVVTLAPEDPAQIVEDAYALEEGASLSYEAVLTGKIISVDEAYSSTFKNITVTMAVEGCEDKPIKCYRLKGGGVEALKVGDIITVAGTIKNFYGTIEFNMPRLLPTPAEDGTVTASGTCGDNLTWELYSDGTLEISGSGSMTNFVVSFGPTDDDVWADLSLRNARATSYGEYEPPWPASYVKRIIIHEGVTSIGNYAFYNCTNLTSVMIPDSVTSIGYYVFAYCYSLTDFTVSPNNPIFSSDDRGVLFNKDQTIFVLIPKAISGTYTIPDSITGIGYSAFSDCTGLTGVTIPGSVTSIGNSAFSGCTGLTGVTIPDSVTRIESYAFSGCTGLTGVTIPGSVTSIGEYAFRNCASLTGITIPGSVTNIGGYAFSSCKNLANAYFCGDAPVFGNNPFESSGYEVDEIWGDDYFLKLHYHTGTAGWDDVTDYEMTGWYGECRIVESAHICPNYTYDNNHSCTTDGTERAVCLTCGALDIRKVAGSAAHRCSYVSNNDATCIADGTKTGKCVICGVTDTVTDPGTAFGHTYSDYVSDGNATCTADGTKTKTCVTCGSRSTVTDPGSATGHSFTNYISDNNYTCMVDGTETAKCDRCDATDIRLDSGSMAHRYIDGSCIYCGESGLISASLRGTVTVFAEGPVMLELLSDSGERTELSVSEGTYQLDCIVPGDYTLTVSQTGSVTRSYSLTLGEGENTLDLKLHLPGDINGDGRRNMSDVARINAHAKRTVFLTGYELLCADFSGDGRVNIGDTAKVYAIIKGTIL